jgi:nitroreductase
MRLGRVDGMTSTELGSLAYPATQPSVADVERALALAVRAPSIHNTQPWRFVLTPDALELWADRRRQLPTADLDGRALLLSCGGALYLAGLGLAAQRWRTAVERLPDPDEPDLLARVRFVGRHPADGPVPLLAAAAAERRHTERRPFGPGVVSTVLLDSLCAAIEDRALYGHVVTRPAERLDLAVAVSWADGLEAGDPAFQAELARWVRADAEATGEGVSTAAVPHVPAGRPRHTEVPVRDFEIGAPGAQELAGGLDEQPAYLVLFSREDDAATRLRSGEAYARVSVEIERLGLASSAITQALDTPGVRSRVRELMSWPDHPQMILRIGWPPAGDRALRTPRRPVSDVLTVARPGDPALPA